jgi:alkylhydroperoxidase family enzyme
MPRLAPVAALHDEPVSPDDLVAVTVANIRSIYEHRPEIAEARAGLVAAMERSNTLGPRLTELLRLRVAFHNQCRPCMAARQAPDVVDEGLVCSLERPQEADDLSDAERAALRYLDLFATDHLAIDDAIHDELRRHFEEGQIAELGMRCAFWVGFGRLQATWHVVEHLPAAFRDAPTGERLAPWTATVQADC